MQKNGPRRPPPARGERAGTAERREDSRQRIVDAARRLFAERGYEHTTMSDIADSVGISGPALYHYFPSKEELLFRGLEAAMEAVLACAEAALDAERSAAGRLSALVEAQTLHEIRAAATAPFVNAHLYGPQRRAAPLPPDRDATLRQLQRRLFDHYRAAIEAGIASGEFRTSDPTLTAFAILGMVQYAATWFRPGGRASAARVARHHAALALAMAEGRQSPETAP